MRGPPKLPWNEYAKDAGFPDARTWLTHLYHEKDMHQREIADRVGVHPDTLFRALRYYGVPRKGPRGSTRRIVGTLEARVQALPHWRAAPLRSLVAVLGADPGNVCNARRRLLEKEKKSEHLLTSDEAYCILQPTE